MGSGSHVLVADDFPNSDPNNPGLAFNKGVDVGPSVVVPGDCTGPGPSFVCGPYSATNTFTGTFFGMGVAIDFTLSARDAMGFSGQVTQSNYVPEPATLLLMGSGLLGFAGWRRYSSRA